MEGKIITLTTDFGLRDPYAAEMKAAILGICPAATIIDVTHEVEKFNVRMGAYILASAARHFPKGTIHVAVVDPEVGTQRQPLLIQTNNGFLIGPDNGLIALASEREGIVEVRQITNRRLMLPQVSNTFHGRDLFAPAAAHVANGVPPEEFGPVARDFMRPNFARITFSGTTLMGEVLYVDGFGNVITNISEKDLTQLQLRRGSLTLNARKLQFEICKTYGENKPHQFLTLVGSHGYLEIAVCQGNAAEMVGAKVGDRIRLTKA